MKIIIISDTHSSSDSIPSFLSELFDDYEMIIHAGDFDSLQFYKALEATGKLKAVHGNSDEPAVREILSEKLVFEVEGVKIGIIHEASLSIVDNTATRYMALEMGVDVLVFGHLHRPIIEKSDVLLICPGSPTKPRMSDPCAVELEINNGTVATNIIPITGQSCGYIDYSRKLGENKS
ncbi:phosphoesterase, MJ0936 family [Methanolobus tindarius DSM 2278]|uniref:Phosphoesterase n=1 Tax=Methanolobus tindarius DSM 2278 TaxID=1090322 RepID=W9DSM1_METTI|nr:metallophosphoesterase [Methanolobus tindarius]ETA68595.1 phosphoesterase, MJ0936 family [Methanolobus tindarius DSM 2278]